MAIVKVIKEDKKGRNKLFQDIYNNHIMNKKEFIDRINNKSSVYNKNYYVRKINGIETPVSKPDNKKKNNLE